MTVSETDSRLNQKEVSMSDNVDNRCLQFVAAAALQVCGFFYLGMGSGTKTDDFSEKFQRGGGSFSFPKI